MATCKECKFWKSSFGSNGSQSIEWYNQYVPEGFIGFCELTEWASGKSSTKAIACDHEGYAAELWTRPDFGCNQFSPKDE